MKLARKTLVILGLGLFGGAVCGLVVSITATFFGPVTVPLDSPHAGEFLQVAIWQGLAVGLPLGLVLAPLGYLYVAGRVSTTEAAVTAGIATIILGSAFAMAAGPQAGLAGGVLGFWFGILRHAFPLAGPRHRDHAST
jgi:hypothetical protein